MLSFIRVSLVMVSVHSSIGEAAFQNAYYGMFLLCGGYFADYIGFGWTDRFFAGGSCKYEIRRGKLKKLDNL